MAVAKTAPGGSSNASAPKTWPGPATSRIAWSRPFRLRSWICPDRTTHTLEDASPSRWSTAPFFFLRVLKAAATFLRGASGRPDHSGTDRKARTSVRSWSFTWSDPRTRSKSSAASATHDTSPSASTFAPRGADSNNASSPK